MTFAGDKRYARRQKRYDQANKILIDTELEAEKHPFSNPHDAKMMKARKLRYKARQNLTKGPTSNQLINPFTRKVMVVNVDDALHQKATKMASSHMGNRIAQLKKMPKGSRKLKLMQDVNSGASYLAQKHREHMDRMTQGSWSKRKSNI